MWMNINSPYCKYFAYILWGLILPLFAVCFSRTKHGAILGLSDVNEASPAAESAASWVDNNKNNNDDDNKKSIL